MKIKTHKKKKSKNQRGNTTYGHGSRKKWKKSGHHGGCGMAGTGKRADHKKSLVINLYGNNYFGKQGVTSRKSFKKNNEVINLNDIELKLDSLLKKHGKDKEIILKGYKILGEGELKQALTIKAKAFSESAKEKIEKAGGKAILIKNEEPKENKEKETSKSIKPKVIKEKKKK
ncbi:MAG: uL15m family ribosomal protein [Nanoarchaeota archaeon]|nr:uL15m family ribosomal protein [Nanoarchaeota archaeon]